MFAQFVEHGYGAIFCKLCQSADPVVRMNTAEALAEFVTEMDWEAGTGRDSVRRKAFLDGAPAATLDGVGGTGGGDGGQGGLSCVLALIHFDRKLLEPDMAKCVRRTADQAVVVLAWLLQEEEIKDVLFKDPEALSLLATDVASGGLEEESTSTIMSLLDELLQDETLRRKTAAHEACCEVLTALLITNQTDQAILALKNIQQMFVASENAKIQRSYIRAVVTMKPNPDIGVRRFKADILKLAAESQGPVSEHMVVLGADLVAALRDLLNTEVIELVRAVVKIIFELTNCDTHLLPVRNEVERLLDDALLIDAGADDTATLVRRCKGRLDGQAEAALARESWFERRNRSLWRTARSKLNAVSAMPGVKTALLEAPMVCIGGVARVAENRRAVSPASSPSRSRTLTGGGVNRTFGRDGHGGLEEEDEEEGEVRDEVEVAGSTEPARGGHDVDRVMMQLPSSAERSDVDV
jgi:hypothetical protein